MTHYRGEKVVGVGGWWERVGSQRWLKPSIRTLWTSYESKRCQPQAQTCLEGIRDVLLSLVEISDPCLPCSTLSHEFTGLAKLSRPVNQACYWHCGCVPISWNRPSVTI